MSNYLPTVFGENLMDVFDDFDRNFFRGFGNVDRALYGKHAQHMMPQGQHSVCGHADYSQPGVFQGQVPKGDSGLLPEGGGLPH